MEYEFHQELKSAVYHFMRRNNWVVAREVQLPNHRIADIIAMNIAARVLIVEVKTTAKDYLLCEAVNKYGAYCDGLYIAIPEREAENLNHEPLLLTFMQEWGTVGILGVRGRKISIMRQPVAKNIPTERRLDILERIARARPAW